MRKTMLFFALVIVSVIIALIPYFMHKMEIKRLQAQVRIAEANKQELLEVYSGLQQQEENLLARLSLVRNEKQENKQLQYEMDEKIDQLLVQLDNVRNRKIVTVTETSKADNDIFYTGFAGMWDRVFRGSIAQTLNGDRRDKIGSIRSADQIKRIFVHHTATRADLSASEMALSMRRTYVDNRNFDFIPTHYIIDANGVIERVNTIDRIVGATLNNDANEYGVHIELVGDFNKHKPTDNQYKALNILIDRLSDFLPADYTITGHENAQKKNCPGKLFDWYRLQPVK